MRIPDQYAVAVAGGQASDVLAAAGMVAQRHQLGMLLQRLRVDPAPALLAVAHAALAGRLSQAQRRREVRLDGRRSGEVVSEALAWWLDATCRECGGVRWRARDRRLTGQVCPACRGSGLRGLVGEAEGWVIAQLDLAVSRSEAAHCRAVGR